MPENSFEIMIREFMASNSKRNFAIITTSKKIRENAYAYLHGHTVGGTNPSLIEALGSTDLNLLIDVGFNQEVAEDTALYWSSDIDDLRKLIDKVDAMSIESIHELGKKAKKRVADAYTWEYIGYKYEQLFLENIK